MRYLKAGAQVVQRVREIIETLLEKSLASVRGSGSVYYLVVHHEHA